MLNRLFRQENQDLENTRNIIDNDDLFSDTDKGKLLALSEDPELYSSQALFTCLGKIERYKIHPSISTDERIQTGWRILSDVFRTKWGPLLKQEQAVVCLWGSTIFSDPINLDYDITIILKKSNPRIFSFVYENKMHKAISEPWIEMGGSFGHISINSLKNISRFLSTINDGSNLSQDTYVYDVISSITEILTGNTEFSGLSEAKVGQIRDSLLADISDNPALRMIMVNKLNDIIRERQSRR